MTKDTPTVSGEAELKPKTRKIAIVGSSPRSRDDAPYDDPSWEIWAINFGYLYMKRWDRFFDLHDMTRVDPNSPDHLERLKEMPNLWTRQPYEGLNSKVFPLVELMKHFGSSYFTNSLAYLMALALYEGCTEIGVWGVDMEASEEYRNQRACFEYWLGLAKGMGVNIYIPEQSELLKTAVMYGYEIATDHKEKLIQGRERELNHLIEKGKEEIQSMRDAITKGRATIQAAELEAGERIREKEAQLCMMMGALEQLKLSRRWG